MITMTIPGKPQPKQRARKGWNGRWYTPEKTRNFERLVSNVAIVAIPSAWKKDETYRVTLTFFMPDKRWRDIDNCAKSVLDGLNGLAWYDDSQIAELTLRKELDRDSPRTEVEIDTL